MITNGFTYIAVLLLLAATLVTLEKNTGWKFFKFIPAVVLLYLLSMVLCSEDPILGGAVFNEKEITVSDAPGLGIQGIEEGRLIYID